MSTFTGHIREFPSIQVDYFRHGPRPPSAAFLSHVHSDHLVGLEIFKASFIYCSTATRQLLLNLRRYPSRLLFSNGTFGEIRRTYGHLKTLLKPLPLETRTVITLAPGIDIAVSLFPANHCPGSTMFLFEGNGHAVLYTGDIRSEPWHVNSLARHPLLLPYAQGHCALTNAQPLDCIYIDTTFLGPVHFDDKAKGIAELLNKVREFPQDTIFLVHAWTYGYEDVWVALAKELKSKVHLHPYALSVYASLNITQIVPPLIHHTCPEAAPLLGFQCGNDFHPGILTLDPSVRIHSCTRHNDGCPALENAQNVVEIRPILAHEGENGRQEVVLESGLGGGGEDLRETFEVGVEAVDDPLELEVIQAEAPSVRTALQKTLHSRDLVLDSSTPNDSSSIITALLKTTTHKQASSTVTNHKATTRKTITFPYSRHSSYPELCDLVSTFCPRDVWPCTENADEWLAAGVSIRGLFGGICSGESFAYDDEVLMARQEECRDVDVDVDVDVETEETEESGEESVWADDDVECSQRMIPIVVESTEVQVTLNRSPNPQITNDEEPLPVCLPSTLPSLKVPRFQRPPLQSVIVLSDSESDLESNFDNSRHGGPDKSRGPQVRGVLSGVIAGVGGLGGDAAVSERELEALRQTVDSLDSWRRRRVFESVLRGDDVDIWDE